MPSFPKEAGICGSEVADEQGLHSFREDHARRLHGLVSEELLLRVQAEAAPGIPVAAMDVGVAQ